MLLRNADPSVHYRAAAADAESLLVLEPGNPAGLGNRGMARMGLADWHARTGADPQAGWEQALEAFDAVIAANPKDVPRRRASGSRSDWSPRCATSMPRWRWTGGTCRCASSGHGSR